MLAAEPYPVDIGWERLEHANQKEDEEETSKHPRHAHAHPPHTLQHNTYNKGYPRYSYSIYIYLSLYLYLYNTYTYKTHSVQMDDPPGIHT